MVSFLAQTQTTRSCNTRCTQILSLSFTVSGNDKANPSRTMKLIQKSPKPQMPAWIRFEYTLWRPKLRTAHCITCNKLVLRGWHYLQVWFGRAISNYSILTTIFPGWTKTRSSKILQNPAASYVVLGNISIHIFVCGKSPFPHLPHKEHNRSSSQLLHVIDGVSKE